MDETEAGKLFGDDYKPPVARVIVQEEDEWSAWATSIELKLSKQGQTIILIGAAAGVALVIGLLQGKVVMNLMKTQAQIVEGLNGLAGQKQVEQRSSPKHEAKPTNDAVNEDAKPSSTVSYATPTGKVTSAPAPVDTTELEELMRTMDAAQEETNLQNKSKEL